MAYECYMNHNFRFRFEKIFENLIFISGPNLIWLQVKLQAQGSQILMQNAAYLVLVPQLLGTDGCNESNQAKISAFFVTFYQMLDCLPWFFSLWIK